jgi:hypothetical protein
MSNAERILRALDAKLTAAVELTLYGRAALLLGFPSPPKEAALSRDVDAVLWMGQAEELDATTNFWQAVEALNQELAPDGLYISHFFAEDQVVLRPGWRESRVSIPGSWADLVLFRLGDADLLLSKLMRDDPIDRRDALFIVKSAGLAPDEVDAALRAARIPDIPEIQEQFQLASRRLLDTLTDTHA